jgi:hypothetical protein
MPDVRATRPRCVGVSVCRCVGVSVDVIVRLIVRVTTSQEFARRIRRSYRARDIRPLEWDRQRDISWLLVQPMRCCSQRGEDTSKRSRTKEDITESP